MIPNSKSFDGKSFYEFNGKTFYRWHYVKIKGKYTLHFRIVSVNSCHKQGIALFFSDFKGTIFLNGTKLAIPKGRFKHYIFKADSIPNGEFTLDVCAKEGYLYFANASEVPGDNGYECGALGCAFWIESIGCERSRFHCNDHEYDDDFDDFVFDLEVKRFSEEL